VKRSVFVARHGRRREREPKILQDSLESGGLARVFAPDWPLAESFHGETAIFLIVEKHDEASLGSQRS